MKQIDQHNVPAVGWKMWEGAADKVGRFVVIVRSNVVRNIRYLPSGVVLPQPAFYGAGYVVFVTDIRCQRKYWHNECSSSFGVKWVRLKAAAMSVLIGIFQNANSKLKLLHQYIVFIEKFTNEFIGQGRKKLIHKYRLFSLESHHQSAFSFGNGIHDVNGTFF